MFLKALVLSSALLSASSFPVNEVQHPLAPLTKPFSLDTLRLVSTLDAKEPVWMLEGDKLRLKASGQFIIDITDGDVDGSAISFLTSNTTYPSPNSTIPQTLFSSLSITNARKTIKHLTSFHTRYYNSDTGREASSYLYKTLLGYALGVASRDATTGRIVTVTPIPHTFKQYSIIVRISSAASFEKDEPVSIVGAHLDSINHSDPFSRAPGADDDGSGTVSLLEACRVLIASSYIPATPIEFHWYAGEEGGGLGSRAIVQKYVDEKVQVKGMVEMDMTAWVANGTTPRIGILSGNDNPALTSFNRLVAKEYLPIPHVNTSFPPGSGTDSFLWHRAGYPASAVLESTYEDGGFGYIHSDKDTSDYPEFSFEHMIEFSKFAIAYIVNLSGQL